MLSKNLREIRIKRGYNQGKLAKLSGINRQTIVNIETDVQKNPRLDTLIALSKALKVSITTLIK